MRRKILISHSVGQFYDLGSQRPLCKMVLLTMVNTKVVPRRLSILSVAVVTRSSRHLSPRRRLTAAQHLGLIVPDPDVRSIATKLLPPSGEYRAPETFTGPDNFTARSDIWALGCITFELATRKKAFATVTALQKYTFSSERLTILAPAGSGDSNRALEEVNTLINDMLQRNPDERPSAVREI